MSVSFQPVSNVCKTEEIEGLVASAYGILFTNREHLPFQVRSGRYRERIIPPRLEDRPGRGNVALFM
jgi:hypothetical protein